MGEDVRRKIELIEKLPTISAIQPRLFEALRKETVTINELVDIIRRDQVMATRIVSMANAPAYGHNGKISTIEQAVLMLGFDTVKTIALGVSLFVMFPLSKVVLKRLWAHSCTIAVLSDAIYLRKGGEARGVCFLAGLVHDIGRLVLVHLDQDVYFREILDKGVARDRDLIGIERQRYQCDHQEAGSWFLETLGMPDEVVQAALYHHDAEGASRHGNVVTAVYLADAISASCDENVYGDGAWTEAHEKVATDFGFRGPDRAGLLELFELERKRLKEFFGF